MGTIFIFTGQANKIIGAIIEGLSLVVLVYYAGKYARDKAKEYGLTNSIFLTTIYMVELAIGAGFFLWVPDYFEKKIGIPDVATSLRWLAIFGAGYAYFRQRKHSEKRGLSSFLFHYIVLLTGWMIDSWVGMLCISIPILLVYYHIMQRLALAVMPLSNPADRKERQTRFTALFLYTWGLQTSFWKAGSNTAKSLEKRIEGEANPLIKKYGDLLWMFSHQVVGIAKGAKFRVDGPGLLFLEKGEQPIELVDLRNQFRSSRIQAISMEGIPIEADVSIAFCIDRDEWEKEEHQELRRKNPMLREARELNKNRNGTFPYSEARIKAAISQRSKKIVSDAEEIKYWEEHVLSMAEEAAREVLSERHIEDLWKARENENSTASEEITTQMKSLIQEPLRQIGIRVLTTKAANFSLNKNEMDDEQDAVTRQQLATWTVDLERQRNMKIADDVAESNRIQEEAHAYAHSVLLTAIAEGLEQTRALHPNLPRYVIAMRFVGALEKIMTDEPLDPQENVKALDELRAIKSRLLPNSKSE